MVKAIPPEPTYLGSYSSPAVHCMALLDLSGPQLFSSVKGDNHSTSSSGVCWRLRGLKCVKISEQYVAQRKDYVNVALIIIVWFQLLLLGCVTLGKLFDISEPRIPPLWE